MCKTDVTSASYAGIPRIQRIHPLEYVKIEGLETQEVEAILTELPFAVLGRDVLNQLYLYLEGPGQKFEVSAAPVRR